MPGLTNLCSVFSVEWFLLLRNPLVDTSKQFTLQLRCVMSKEKPCRFFSLSKCPGRIGQPKTPWNLVSNSGWVRLRARPVEAVIRETSGDPGVSLRPLSRLFTMPAARRDNALQLSTSKDAQERRIIDDDIWEIGGTSFSMAGSRGRVSCYPIYMAILSLNCSSNTTNFTQSIYKIF